MAITVRQLILELLEFNLDAKVLDDLMISWSDNDSEQNVVDSKRRTEYVILCPQLPKDKEENYDR